MKTNYVQSNFLSGVLDPRASGRIDTDAYNNGLLCGDNCVPVHLGGMRRRGGLRYRATLPNALTIIDGATITATAPQGGTANNAKDNLTSTVLLTTGNVGVVNPYIVSHYDLGSAKTVLYADALNIFSTGGSSTQFAIQYSTDDAAWTTLGTSFDNISTVSRSYRRAGPVTARYWRIAKIGGTDMGAVQISVSDFNLWQDSGTVSAVRLLPFEISTEDRYVVALTDRSATVFQNGAVVARVPTPYAGADLSEVDAATNAETMVIVHEDYAPRFLLREGTNNFQPDTVVFDHVPQNDYADASSSTPVSDVQSIVFSAGWVQGNTFQFELEGARTATITFAGDTGATDQAATAANIAREVQKLFTVPGFTGVSCARTGALTYTVTFALASAKAYKLASIVPLSSTGTATIVQTQVGTSRGEDAWSVTRGYPRTTTFFGGRLWFGGTRSLQQSLFGSGVNNILDFEILEGLDDEAVFTTLSGQQLNAINGLFAGRTLQMHTSGSAFRYAKAQGVPVTPNDAPADQTQPGAAKIRPVPNDGVTVYVARNRKSIRDFRFDYEEDAFNSLGISSLAPHLINNVVDLASWDGSSTDEINLVFVINGDGTAAILNSRKESQVQAWTPWTTFDGSVDNSGGFKAVTAVLEDVYFGVQRTLNGVKYVFLEQLDDTIYTDCAIQQTQASSTTVTGLSHLNGKVCRVRADGFVLGNVTPTAGSATIGQPGIDVEIGLDWTPNITPMPLNTILPVGGIGPNFMQKRRIVEVRARIRNTLGLLVNGRPIADRRFDLNSFDEAATPVSGNVRIEETTNWDQAEDKLVSLTQVDPLPFEILAIQVQIESNP